MFSSS